MPLVKSGEHEWNMDGFLVSNLDVAAKSIRKDWDMLFTVDGMEGSGKSVLAIQCCKYLDPEFDESNIAFNPTEFVNLITNAKQYSAVLYDEAYAGLSSRSTISSTNKVITGVLAEIRQKNLFVFIVQPCFFELDRYVSLWRSRALLHVFTGDNMKRGRFSFYSYKKKKLLWILGKKFFDYSKPTPDFIGSFNNYYPINEEIYRERKFKALKFREDTGRRTPEDKVKEKIYRAVIYLRDEENWVFEKIGKVFGHTKKWACDFYAEALEFLPKKPQKSEVTA